jgi:hypothetical protein
MFDLGLSIDLTHTEPYAYKAQFWGNALSMSSLPQHLSTTRVGKGGFAVSFYVQLQMKRNICDSRSANSRRVRKLPCKAGLARDSRGHAPQSLCSIFLLASIGQQPPTTSFTGSDNKSPLPLGISVPANTNVQV